VTPVAVMIRSMDAKRTSYTALTEQDLV